jgi:deoxyribonuclease-4
MTSKTKKISQKKKINKNSNKTNKYALKSNQLHIGCHISITPSILDGIKYGESIGGNAFQIFMGNNRSASLKAKTKLEPEECKEIKEYVSRNNLILVIHSIYLLNFCSYPPYSGHIKYMHTNIQYDLKYGSLIGAKCVVLHIGFKNDLTEEEAMKNLIANINYICKNIPSGIMLSLETSACKGSEMGCTLEQLETIWKGVRHNNRQGHNKVGFVIDTAHIFSSGYDISNIPGISDYLKKFDKLIGLNNVCTFHINDAKYKLGAHKDEHMGIGSGTIFNTDSGMKSLKYIKKLCIKKKIPMILETHSAGKQDSEGSKGHGYEYEIDLIKKL